MGAVKAGNFRQSDCCKLCAGENTILGSQTITTQATYAAMISIDVECPFAVDGAGDLELIAPSIVLHAGFSVVCQFTLISTQPLPPAE